MSSRSAELTPRARAALAEANRIEAAIDAEIKAGRLTAEDLGPLRDADLFAVEADADARGMEAAAARMRGTI